MATTKVRDYAKLAKGIRDAIGESNITSATHCATRLRLVLKESPSEVQEQGSVIKRNLLTGIKMSFRRMERNFNNKELRKRGKRDEKF